MCDYRKDRGLVLDKGILGVDRPQELDGGLGGLLFQSQAKNCDVADCVIEKSSVCCLSVRIAALAPSHRTCRGQS